MYSLVDSAVSSQVGSRSPPFPIVFIVFGPMDHKIDQWIDVDNFMQSPLETNDCLCERERDDEDGF